MPLEVGSSPEAIARNIKELVSAGHPQEQAVAIAERLARGDGGNADGLRFDGGAESYGEPEQRYDFSRLAGSKVSRTSQGFARMPANLTRTGVFKYTNPDGTTRRELRLPEEVFAQDSLDSLRDAPVVWGHPAMVTPANIREHEIGHISGTPKGDGVRLVSGELVVKRADGLAKVDSGEGQELSCGYKCHTEMRSGVYQGEKFDCIQRGIVYNHVGMGPKGWGRAGGDVALRLDGLYATIEVQPEVTISEISAPMKIRFDGQELDLASEVNVNAIQSRLDSQATALKTATTERDTLQAKLDSSTADVAKLTANLTAALDPKRIDSAVESRVALVVSAAKVLGDDAKFDGKTEREIQALVIAKVQPSAKLDGKSDDYVSARFDACLETASASKTVSNFANAFAGVNLDGLDEAARKDEKEAKEARANQHKAPLAMSKGK